MEWQAASVQWQLYVPDTPTCALPVLKGSSSLGVAMLSSAVRWANER